MRALQQGGTEPLDRKDRCCFVVYGFLMAASVVGATPSAAASRDLEEFAQVYVNQYHEPDPALLLSKKGKDRSRALAYYAIGRKLENQGRTDDAIESYLKVLQLDDNAQALSRKTAHLLARNGQQEKAFQLLEANLAKHPDEAFPYISLSEFLATYYSADPAKQDRAVEIIESAVKKFPDEPAVYERVVQLYLVANRKDDARAVIDAARKRHQSDPHYWLRLGILAARVWPIQLNAKNNEPVVLNEFFQKALSHAGGDETVMEQSADFFRSTKQFELAKPVYQDIIKDHPDLLDVRKKLALTYAGLQDESHLIETLEGIVEIDPENAETHREIAQIYLKRGDTSLAIPHLKAVLRINREGAQAYLALAALMVRPKEGKKIDPKMADEAVHFLDHAAYLFPDSPDFPNFAARILRATEKWSEAVKKTEIALKLAEKNKPEIFNEDFYFGFAASVERSGDIPRAEKLFRKTIELINKNQPETDPNHTYQKFVAQTYNYLGYMWLENDMNIDEAGEMIKTAVDLDPDSGAIADSIGWFHFKKGRYAEAKKELLRAEKLTENPDGVIYDHIGRTLFKNGETARAVDYMEKAVQLEPKKKEFMDRLKQFQKRLKEEPKAPATESAATAKPKQAIASEKSAQSAQ